jgi:hypothetical protein
MTNQFLGEVPTDSNSNPPLVSYTVIFNSNGGTTEADPTSRTVASGEGVTLPTAPTRDDGLTFAGWNTAADGSGGWFTTATPVTESIIVYAQWTEFTYTTSNDEVTIIGYTGAATDIIIPSTIEGKPVTSIGNLAFENRISLTSVIIPAGVTSIGDHAFDGCSSLTSVTIPDSVTSIGDSAFSGCMYLTSITLGAYDSSIHSSLFNNTGIDGESSLQSAWASGDAGTYLWDGSDWTKQP